MRHRLLIILILQTAALAVISCSGPSKQVLIIDDDDDLFPVDPTTVTDPEQTDSDGDGIGDDDEKNIYGTDPNSRDTDGDGWWDLNEIAAGSDPLDSSDVPKTCTDSDGDSYGIGCIGGIDCNDADGDVNPGAEEIVYNGVDDDCDSSTYDDDLDGDGFLASNDCDDRDGLIWENVSGYEDRDGDGSTVEGEVVFCTSGSLPEGFRSSPSAVTDCNDGSASISPAAAEICGNDIDEDCRGGPEPCPQYCIDDDGDGFGQSCEAGPDCDDSDAAVNPSGAEVVYNGKDDDCNTATRDDDLDLDGFNKISDCDDANPTVWKNLAGYADADGDKWSVGNVKFFCSSGNLPLGYFSSPSTPPDCNDSSAGINPGAAEICGNQVDEDCLAGDLVCPPQCIDNDGDGYGSGCAAGEDCDDAKDSINPGVAEIIGNGIDDDCNPVTLDNPPPAVLNSESAYLLNSNFLIISVDATPNCDGTVEANYGANNPAPFASPPQTVIANEPATITIYGLKPSLTYEVQLKLQCDSGSNTIGMIHQILTGDWPGDWPRINATDYTNGALWNSGEWTENEVFCTSTISGSTKFFCFNRLGNPVWYFDLPQQYGPALWFRPLSDGTFVAVATGSLVFFDVKGAVVNTISISDIFGQTKYEHNKFHHDVIEITEGPWAGAVAALTSSNDSVDHPVYQYPIDPTTNEFLNMPYTMTEPINEVIDGSGLVVINPVDRTVLWDWSSHGVQGDSQSISPEMLPYTRRGIKRVFGFPSNVDWTHANAIIHEVQDGKQYFWMSLRHQDWLIKIDVLTDDIVWRLGYLGDFELVDDIHSPIPQSVLPEFWFYHQHAPEWISRANGVYDFVLFDNGNFRPAPTVEAYLGSEYGRGVEFLIDENSRKAQMLFAYGEKDGLSPDHFYSPIMGDADMMPDGAGVLFDSAYDRSLGGGLIMDVSYPAGILRWRATVLGSSGAYRVHYFPSIYNRAK